jgi:hypothetical protein
VQVRRVTQWARHQSLDGTWRTIDGKALFQATLALSEMYDNLIAGHATAALGIGWEERDRGPRWPRIPAEWVENSVDAVERLATSGRLSDLIGDRRRIHIA